MVGRSKSKLFVSRISFGDSPHRRQPPYRKSLGIFLAETAKIDDLIALDVAGILHQLPPRFISRITFEQGNEIYAIQIPFVRHFIIDISAILNITIQFTFTEVPNSNFNFVNTFNLRS